MVRKVMVCVVAAGLLGACDKEDPTIKKAADATKSAAGKTADAMKDAGKAAGDAAKDAGKATSEAVKGAAKATGDAAKESFTALRDKAVAELQPKMDSLKKMIDDAKSKVDASGPTVKPLVEPLYKSVADQFGALQSKFSSLSGAGADTWEKTISEIKAAYPAVEKSVSELMARLK